MKIFALLPGLTISRGASRGSIVFVFFLMLLVLVGSVPAAHAATITVNSTADTTASDSVCTLREAIINANNNAATWGDCSAGSGTDVINITATGTITLLSALPDLTDSLTIDGPGFRLTIDATNLYLFFRVSSGGTYNFQNLTIANGSAAFGGGIRLDTTASVSVNNVYFSGNSAGNAGGAIYSGGAALTVTNSTFMDNSGYGGAIINDGSGTLNGNQQHFC